MRARALRLAVLLFSFVAALLPSEAASPAMAVPATQCTTTNQFNIDPPKYFHYEICGVPDIDQRKTASGDVDGLPADGVCHCVPTSQANWLAYIANHGYDEVFPGPGNYQAGPPDFTEVYNRMTLAQGLLGQAMGTKTDPEGDECGTNGSNAKTATEGWLDAFGVGSDFSVLVDGGDPRLKDAVATAHLGGLVRLSVGWYKFANPQLSAIVRDGGHAVSLVYAQGDLDDDQAVVGIHDPATVDDTTTQSLFTRDEYDAHDIPVNVMDPETGEVSEQVLTRIVEYGTGYMDGFSAIIPKFGLTPGPGGGIDALYPGGLTNHPGPTTGPLLPPSVGTVVDTALVPHKSRQLVILEGRDEISAVDRIGGHLTTFAPLPGVRRVIFGGYDERVYALLHQVEESSDQAGRVVSTGENVAMVLFDLEGRELKRVNSAVPYAEIAFDPLRQRLLALDLRGGVIDAFSADLEPQGTVATGVVRGGTTGSLTVGPRDGTAWVHVDGTGTATRIDFSADGGTATRMEPVRLGDGSALVGLHASDDGLLYATRDGTIVSFNGDGSRSGGTSLDGLRAGGRLRLSWSYTNVAPDEQTSRAYRNVLPEDAG